METEERRLELKRLKKEHSSAVKDRHRLQLRAAGQRKYRSEIKRGMEELRSEYPEADVFLKKRFSRTETGRPPLESSEEFQGLHEAIMDIVSLGG